MTDDFVVDIVEAKWLGGYKIALVFDVFRLMVVIWFGMIMNFAFP